LTHYTEIDVSKWNWGKWLFFPVFLPVVRLRMDFHTATTDTNVTDVLNNIILHYRATTKYLTYCKCVSFINIIGISLVNMN
jgi:hypothetical protein